MGEWDLVLYEDGNRTKWITRTFKAEGPLDALRQAESYAREILVQFGTPIAAVDLSRR